MQIFLQPVQLSRKTSIVEIYFIQYKYGLMKKILMPFILLLLWLNISAQKKEVFDIATYQPPKGWKKSTKGGLVSYSISNDAKKTYCIINVYASITSSGTATEEFHKQWQELVASAFEVNEIPQKDTAADDDGREVIVGAAGFVRGSLTGVAMLSTYVGFGRTTCILTLTNDGSYQTYIENFLAAFSLKKTAPVKPAAVTAKTTITTSSGNVFHNTNKLEGVWNGLNVNYNLNSYGGNFLKPNTPIWITFFDNGRVYNMLPDDMARFNKSAGDMGYYRISNNAASLQWFKGTASTNIQFINNDKIRISAATGDQDYFRCKPVDGAKLDGVWTTYDNTKDPDLDAPGTKPQIHFSKDGHFTDEGIFMTVFNDVKTQPGSGTYSLNNFTLTLKYNNGTTRQSSFTCFLSGDANTDINIIFIERHRLRKR